MMMWLIFIGFTLVFLYQFAGFAIHVISCLLGFVKTNEYGWSWNPWLVLWSWVLVLSPFIMWEIVKPA